MSSSSTTKSKELKIVARHVVTLGQIEEDPMKLRLLFVMREFGELSEKALQHLVYHLRQKNVGLDYEFNFIGGVPSSRRLREDLMALLYVGLIETNPRTKKLRLTKSGEEFLEKRKDKVTEANEIRKGIEEVRTKIASLDAELELQALLERQSRRRRFKRV